MDTTFEFLGLTGHAYGLCAAIAAGVLFVLMALLGKKRGLPAGTVPLFGVLALPLAVVGARVLYCAFHLSEFTETFENPWLMLNFFDGGLSMAGAVGGLMLAAIIAARVQKTSFANLADVLCVPMGLALAILRFGEQFTDLGVGKVVEEGRLTANVPWLFVQSRMGKAIEFRLNVWAYEAVCGVLLFAVLMFLLSRCKKLRDGDLALVFFTLYGATQVLWESMRDDGHMLIIFLRIGQLAAAIMLLTSGIILTRRLPKAYKARRVITGVLLTVGVLGVVALEFSLDGRLTIGIPSLGRDYGIMAALCALMAALPCAHLYTLYKARTHDC